MAQPGIRATQLADLIRDHVAQWIHRDHAGIFVSVNQVTLKTDLSKATVWVTVFPEKFRGQTMTSLQKKSSAYSKALRTVIRRHSVPVITFSLDTSAEDEAAIDTLLK